jgi:hypothetical protein
MIGQEFLLVRSRYARHSSATRSNQVLLMSAEESQTHTTEEEQSITGYAELGAYTVGAESAAANGTA